MTVTPNEVRELVLHAAGHCNQTATADRSGILDPNLRAEYLHDALMCARPGVPASKYAAAVDAALAQAKAVQGSRALELQGSSATSTLARSGQAGIGLCFAAHCCQRGAAAAPEDAAAKHRLGKAGARDWTRRPLESA